MHGEHELVRTALKRLLEPVQLQLAFGATAVVVLFVVHRVEADEGEVLARDITCVPAALEERTTGALGVQAGWCGRLRHREPDLEQVRVVHAFLLAVAGRLVMLEHIVVANSWQDGRRRESLTHHVHDGRDDLLVALPGFSDDG